MVGGRSGSSAVVLVVTESKGSDTTVCAGEGEDILWRLYLAPSSSKLSVHGTAVMLADIWA
jgi:hypothetical protein